MTTESINQGDADSQVVADFWRVTYSRPDGAVIWTALYIPGIQSEPRPLEQIIGPFDVSRGPLTERDSILYAKLAQPQGEERADG